ncbi:hypothetical protein GQ53DRAFT_791193 [Thozetella sp. PMI_491]|nr:hypothetical protein GQ53DRAFT_791193 [Thozetella sp. PMI_491]
MGSAGNFKSFSIYTPSPILGYGYDIHEFWRTVDEANPAAFVLDAGSTDPGPYMLGTGKQLCSKLSYLRDLEPILEACYTKRSKLLVGSAGGAGTNLQVDALVDIVKEISEARGYSFKIATIKFEADRAALLKEAKAGAIVPCGAAPPINPDEITNAVEIVAQMGAEPWIKALNDDPDIIIAGRSYDPAPFAGFCMHRGVRPEPAWHMGKIMECGGLCAVPKGRGMLATMHQDSFELTPPNQSERCTPLSVAAHTFYEKSRPDRLPGPGGVLHLDAATYEQRPDGRTLLVKGSQFVPTPTYQVKLEGASQIGFRSMFLGGLRDPILIEGIDEFIQTVRQTTEMQFPSLIEGTSKLIFHLYGKNAVMGALETHPVTTHEIGIVGEAVATTQEEADAIGSFARVTVLHASYDGQVATAGNLASPLTPLDTPLGPVFNFSVYHLLSVDDPCSLFPIGSVQVGNSQNTSVATTRPTSAAGLKSSVKRASKRSRRTANPRNISEIASVIRSKNAGPFEVTLDILFDTVEDFQRVRDSDVLNASTIKGLYKLSDSDIITLMFYEPALGWKCTFKRPWPQGGVGELDTFGAQQHAPLLGIEL